MGEILTVIFIGAIFAGLFAMMFEDAIRIFMGE